MKMNPAPVVSVGEPILLDFKGVAALLSIPVMAARRLYWEGQLKSVPLGTRKFVFDRADVVALIQKLKRSA